MKNFTTNFAEIDIQKLNRVKLIEEISSLSNEMRREFVDFSHQSWQKIKDLIHSIQIHKKKKKNTDDYHYYSDFKTDPCELINKNIIGNENKTEIVDVEGSYCPHVPF